MVPWPIAMLCALYTVLATSSAATLWRALQGHQHQALLWSLLWGGLCTTVVMGLAGLRPWARRLTLWASALMMVAALGVAGMVVIQARPDPMRSLLATGMAGLQLVLMRYLTRPHVKQWFVQSTRSPDGAHLL